MSPAFLRRSARILPLVLILVASATAVRAQGTPEQRQACTPDALRLCSDTIPDVGRTIACMKAHREALSAGCRQVLAPAASPGAARVRQATRAPAVARVRVAGKATPKRSASLARRPVHPRKRVLARGGDVAQARAIIGGLCGTNLLDDQMCSFIGVALNLTR